MLRASVIVFPGSNCDRDVKVALEQVTGFPVKMVWHGDATVPASDLIVLPGGFSYGDYLRCGAMAAHSPIMRDVIAKAKAGTLRRLDRGRLPGGASRALEHRVRTRDLARRAADHEGRGRLRLRRSRGAPLGRDPGQAPAGDRGVRGQVSRRCGRPTDCR